MNDCSTTINLDVLKVILDATTPSNLARIHAKDTAPRTATPLTKDQAGAARRGQARWQAQSYGKNVWQAVLRYYKGMDGGTWVWKCTKVISATKI